MKKLFFALLAALVLGTSAKGHADDSVTLYGIIDMGIMYTKTEHNLPGDRDGNTLIGIASGVQSGSRFGFRGVSELGNNTSVKFVLENGFDPGNGTFQQGGRLFGRQSTIGIANSNIGQFDIGRQINLASNYFLPIDPFREGFGQANIGATFGSANTLRYSNMLLAQTASVAGISLGAGYSFATGMTSIYVDNGSCHLDGCAISNNAYQYTAANNLRALTLGMKYQQGPVYLAAAFDQIYGPSDIPNGPPPSNPTSWMIGGSYDFNVVAVSGAFGQTRNGIFMGQSQGTGSVSYPNLSNITQGANIMFESDASLSSYMMGLNIPLSSSSILASWQMNQPTNAFKNEARSTQSIYSVGYLYNFSKRTNLYAYVSYANNFAMIDTAKSTVFAVGLRHQF